MTRGLFAVLALVLSLAASLRLPSAPRAPSVGAAPAESASPAPLLQRRAALGLGVLTAFNAAASAYDTLPEVKMDLADAEKRRKEAEGRIQKNKAEAKPYLAKISTAEKPEDFAAACDAFALYIIGKEKFPEGLDARAIRDVIQDAYNSFPTYAYSEGCKGMRTGVCYTKGASIESSYTAVLNVVRKYATKAFKGSLISDGVSAANSAAF